MRLMMKDKTKLKEMFFALMELSVMSRINQSNMIDTAKLDEIIEKYKYMIK
jgi:hypothetical protein